MNGTGATWQLYCWGSTSQGQLGVGAIESESVNTPHVIEQLARREVNSVACGRNHTLFALTDGTVYSCGNNDCGQLGRDNQRTKPSESFELFLIISI